MAIGALAPAGVLVWWFFIANSNDTPTQAAVLAFPVEVTTANILTVVDKVETMGTTRAQEAVGLRPLSGGRLIALSFQPGDRVEKGDTLAQLDSESEQAAVTEARANLIEAERTLKRALSLRATQAVSQSTADELETRRNAAKARLEAAQKDLDERTIRAPFAGVVGFNEFDVGARISAGDLLTTLDDLSVIRVVFQVPERYYGRIRLDQTVNATTPAFPDQTFSARITHVDSRIAEETRAFRVWATHPNDEHPLPAGLTVNVEIVLESRSALVVPEESVVAEAAGPVVFVIEKDENSLDRAIRRPVTTGLRTPNALEILDGVEKGETVVRLGVQRLRDGMPVRILKQGPATDQNLPHPAP